MGKGNNLYLIKIYNENESFYKIGNSVHRYCRFYEIIKHGYKIEIVYMILNLEFYTSYKYEEKLHKKFGIHSYTPLNRFGGYTECYKNIDLKEYKSFVSGIIEGKEIVQKLNISWR